MIQLHQYIVYVLIHYDMARPIRLLRTIFSERGVCARTGAFTYVDASARTEDIAGVQYECTYLFTEY